MNSGADMALIYEQKYAYKYFDSVGGDLKKKHLHHTINNTIGARFLNGSGVFCKMRFVSFRKKTMPHCYVKNCYLVRIYESILKKC
jgi:hypothetical protein